MKLKNVSCTQFAGVLSKDINLSDGINVIYGKNEAGKSTMASLISKVLFKQTKLGNRKEDTDFKKKYFPSAVKNSKNVGDFADGSVCFEVDGEEYKLSKDWGCGAGATLVTPFGILKDEKKINEILREKLVYGEGVYAEMLMPSQHNIASSLCDILNSAKKDGAKQEISDALSKAFVQGDDASIDAIENAIVDKLEGIRGDHWDEDRQMPVRRSNGLRWSQKEGEILKAYYALEDAQNEIKKIKALQDAADHATNEYESIEQKLKELEKDVATLDGFSNAIKLNKEYQKSVDRYKAEIKKLDTIANNWEKYDDSIKKARVLELENSNRQSVDLLAKAKQIKASINSIDSALLNAECPEDTELSAIKNANRQLDRLQNELCGMNINASIKMLGNNNVEIRSLRTNEIIELGDSTNINQAVKITVPDVMEMVLAPADVDVDEVQKGIESQTEIINNIFKKYGVSSIDELEKLSKSIKDAKSNYDLYCQKLDMLLGDVDFNELEKNVSSIEGDVRSYDEISNDVYSLCGAEELDSFITAKKTIVDGYRDEYDSPDKLKSKAFDITKEISILEDKLKDSDNLPLEIKNLSDPEGYLESQKALLKMTRQAREDAFKNKAMCASELESHMANVVGDPVDNVETASRYFDEQKELLSAWQNIYNAFLIQKVAINNSPFDDIAKSFSKYLNIISNGRVESELLDKDRLDVDIYSNNHIVDYDKLSQGTKETVSLAYRLAVIEHLFPDGDSVAVFDDPFTDMDDDRTRAACDIIKEFSKKNQVIVLTCKEDCASMLGGNLIEM